MDLAANMPSKTNTGYPYLALPGAEELGALEGSPEIANEGQNLFSSTLSNFPSSKPSSLSDFPGLRHRGRQLRCTKNAWDMAEPFQSQGPASMAVELGSLSYLL